MLQDDGVGCHLVTRLSLEKSAWPVQFIDGGTISFDLVSPIESSTHIIVLDAVNINQPPGSVQTLINDDLDIFLAKPEKSVHEVSLSDLFDMARLTDLLPAYRAMIAIQPQIITWGENLTKPVDDAQIIAIAHMETLLLDWGILSIDECQLS